MAISLLRENDEFTITDAELVDGGDKDTTFTIRRITPAELKVIEKKHTTKPNYRRPEKLDVEAYRNDVIDFVLRNWTGVLDRGEPVACEREYKLLLSNIRKIAIMERAGMEDVTDAKVQEQENADERAASFRAPASVR
jgi:hypothetical protein